MEETNQFKQFSDTLKKTELNNKVVLCNNLLNEKLVFIMRNKNVLFFICKIKEKKICKPSNYATSMKEKIVY